MAPKPARVSHNDDEVKGSREHERIDAEDKGKVPFKVPYMEVEKE